MKTRTLSILFYGLIWILLCTLSMPSMANELDVLDEITMQVIDLDEDLSKAIPRVIQPPPPQAANLSNPAKKTMSIRPQGQIHQLTTAPTNIQSRPPAQQALTKPSHSTVTRPIIRSKSTATQ